MRLSDPTRGKPVIFNPPYTHQARAVREVLVNNKNLMVMTGIGSGKTESFLLPILGKLAVEAKERSGNFRDFSAVRAIVLYPMNALVNDQLGRLRLLFGHPSVVSMFETWARPARFARYTSRTPYAGMRTPSKDSNRLSSIGDFFVAIEDAAHRHRDGRPGIADEDAKASDLRENLAKRGKWPAKPSVSDWFGRPHTHWRDRNGRYQRAVTGPHDAELLTRHEVHDSPPDLLITNYSMLEYMMMRPIERPIFDKTREWLGICPEEKVLVVLDEAHLYRRAQDAEVGLLLRRLRERLGVGPDCFQVICASASFSEEGQATAGRFGAQLSGFRTTWRSGARKEQGRTPTRMRLRQSIYQNSMAPPRLRRSKGSSRFCVTGTRRLMATLERHSSRPYARFRRSTASSMKQWCRRFRSPNSGTGFFRALAARKKLEQLSRRTILPDFLSDFSSLSGVTGINHR